MSQDAAFQAYLPHIRDCDKSVDGNTELGRYQLLRQSQLKVDEAIPFPVDAVDTKVVDTIPGSVASTTSQEVVAIVGRLSRQSSRRTRNQRAYYVSSGSSQGGSAEHVRFLKGARWRGPPRFLDPPRIWSMENLFAQGHGSFCNFHCGDLHRNLGRGEGRSRDRRPEGRRLMTPNLGNASPQ